MERLSVVPAECTGEATQHGEPPREPFSDSQDERTSGTYSGLLGP